MLGDGSAFGQVVTDESVGVLIAAAFPGRVGMGEVHRHLGGHGERGVPGHLRALIPGQGGS